jgi:hypothetical protein
MRKIGVDKELRPVGNYLRDEGFEVEELDTVDPELHGDFDAIVISGLERDMFGIQDTATKVPIIDATGMTPDEVLDEVKSRIERIQ